VESTPPRYDSNCDTGPSEYSNSYKATEVDHSGTTSDLGSEKATGEHLGSEKAPGDAVDGKKDAVESDDGVEDSSSFAKHVPIGLARSPLLQLLKDHVRMLNTPIKMSEINPVNQHGNDAVHGKILTPHRSVRICRLGPTCPS